MDARFRAAIHQRSDISETLVQGGINGVGIMRVKVNFVGTGVFTGREDQLPTLAAVGGLV